MRQPGCLVRSAIFIVILVCAFIFVVVMSFGLYQSPEHPWTVGELTGVYKIEYRASSGEVVGGTLTLRSNGTYSEDYSIDGRPKIANSGKWKLTRLDKRKLLVVYDMMVLMDGFKLTVPSQKTVVNIGPRMSWGKVVLEVNQDVFYDKVR